jgi:hypothetical protein
MPRCCGGSASPPCWRSCLGSAGVTLPLVIEQDGGARRDVQIPSIDRYRYLKLDTSY